MARWKAWLCRLAGAGRRTPTRRPCRREIRARSAAMRPSAASSTRTSRCQPVGGQRLLGPERLPFRHRSARPAGGLGGVDRQTAAGLTRGARAVRRLCDRVASSRPVRDCLSARGLDGCATASRECFPAWRRHDGCVRYRGAASGGVAPRTGRRVSLARSRIGRSLVQGERAECRGSSSRI